MIKNTISSLKYPSDIIDILQKTTAIAEKLQISAYAVGGFARDIILGCPFRDIDISVSGKTEELSASLAEAMGYEVKSYKKFLTAELSGQGKTAVNIACFRRENYPYYGSLPEVFPASLEEDIKRRDFTVNAIAIELDKTAFKDNRFKIYGYIDDLKRHRLKVFHERSFLEDPTRIIRYIRFKNRYMLDPDDKTCSLYNIAASSGIISSVSRDRLKKEILMLIKEREDTRIRSFIDMNDQNIFRSIFGCDLDISLVSSYENNFSLDREFDFFFLISCLQEESMRIKALSEFSFKKKIINSYIAYLEKRDIMKDIIDNNSDIRLLTDDLRRLHEYTLKLLFLDLDASARKKLIAFSNSSSKKILSKPSEILIENSSQ